MGQVWLTLHNGGEIPGLESYPILFSWLGPGEDGAHGNWKMNGGQVAKKGETLFPTYRRCPQLYPLSTSLNNSLGISWAPGLCWTWGREAQSLNKDYPVELGGK